MKRVALILLLLTSISCSYQSKRDNTHAGDRISPDNFDWLTGSWERSNDKEGNSTYEHWIKNSSTEYTGWGCTLHNSDTIFKENLRLFTSGEEWNFEVTGVNEDPTMFLLIRHGERSFECENKYNEFPKNIRYEMRDNILHAKIWDDETEISFSFEKTQQK